MTKKTTQKIKGIAILIMIAHHFRVYDFGADFSNAWVGIGSNFKICVGIYAVLSGYGYFFAKEKTLTYGLKKVGDCSRNIGLACLHYLFLSLWWREGGNSL